MAEPDTRQHAGPCAGYIADTRRHERDTAHTGPHGPVCCYLLTRTGRVPGTRGAPALVSSCPRDVVAGKPVNGWIRSLWFLPRFAFAWACAGGRGGGGPGTRRNLRIFKINSENHEWLWKNADATPTLCAATRASPARGCVPVVTSDLCVCGVARVSTRRAGRPETHSTLLEATRSPRPPRTTVCDESRHTTDDSVDSAQH
jgi:hypothetical protein